MIGIYVRRHTDVNLEGHLGSGKVVNDIFIPRG